MGIIVHLGVLICLLEGVYTNNQECKTTKMGLEYWGSVNKTKDGRTCQSWILQFPHAHSYIKVFPGTGETPEQAGNNCRNPDKEPGGPWCYTIDPLKRWAYCDIPFCRKSTTEKPVVVVRNSISLAEDCSLEDQGKYYVGAINKTKSGRTCQSWSSQTPHRHTRSKVSMFPDRSLEELGNKCRNPDNEPKGPWCYTTDAKSRWEYCDIPRCLKVKNEQRAIIDEIGCRRSASGSDYTGSLQYTMRGFTCQPWSSQTPHQHSYTDIRKYPDNSFQEAGNFCRNPDMTSPSLWCYTTNPRVRWDRCDVPRCSDFPECKLTKLGSEYRGTKTTTKSGYNCKSWREVNKGISNSTSADDVSDRNYCRGKSHPSASPDNPWCYVHGDQGIEWEECLIPFCKPSAACLSPDGSSGAGYAGLRSVTKSGLPCQRWDKQHPHKHSYSSEMFPESNLTSAENYCRTPVGDKAFCLTLDPTVEREYCDIQLCEECIVSETGREYAGNTNLTGSGQMCISWSSAVADDVVNDPDAFPDVSIGDAKNFCRNPDNRLSGPWCYTDASGTMESCDLPKCQDMPGVKKEYLIPTPHTLPRRAKHVIHIGIDGLNPCFLNASAGVPNIRERLMDEGSWTLTGRTSLISVSAPGWSNIMAGMPVETTGITGNGYVPVHKGGKAKIEPAYGPHIPVPTISAVLKGLDPNIRTANYYDWKWIRYLASYGGPGSLDVDYLCDVKIHGSYYNCDVKSANKASQYIKQIMHSAESSYTFIYLGDVDETGHKKGWCTSQYLSMVHKIDRLVGTIFDAIESRTNAWSDTLVVLNTDHGGSGKGHGKHVDADLQVPIILRGAGIKKGYKIRREVRNQDMAPTILHLMGHPSSPWWQGNIIREVMDTDF